MKLLACIKKDIRLLSGGGPGSLLLLLLPAALLLLVLSFMSGMTTVNSYTEPFSIAVRMDTSPFSSLPMSNPIRPLISRHARSMGSAEAKVIIQPSFT